MGRLVTKYKCQEPGGCRHYANIGSGLCDEHQAQRNARVLERVIADLTERSKQNQMSDDARAASMALATVNRLVRDIDWWRKMYQSTQRDLEQRAARVKELEAEIDEMREREAMFTYTGDDHDG